MEMSRISRGEEDHNPKLSPCVMDSTTVSSSPSGLPTRLKLRGCASFLTPSCVVDSTTISSCPSGPPTGLKGGPFEDFCRPCIVSRGGGEGLFSSNPKPPVVERGET